MTSAPLEEVPLPVCGVRDGRLVFAMMFSQYLTSRRGGLGRRRQPGMEEKVAVLGKEEVARLGYVDASPPGFYSRGWRVARR